MRQRFVRIDNGKAMRLGVGSQILVDSKGRLRVFVPDPTSESLQMIECVLTDVVGAGGIMPRFGSHEVGVRVALLMLAAGGLKYQRTDELQIKQVCFTVIAPRPPVTPARPVLLPANTDPIELLQCTIDVLVDQLGIAIANRLTKRGTPMIRGLGLVYLWEAVLLPQGDLLRQLKPALFKSFEDYVTSLGFQVGGPLPEGDYPWNVPKS